MKLKYLSLNDRLYRYVCLCRSHADDAVLDGLRAETEEFLRIEKEGIKEYKALLEESSGYYHGLFKVLLGSMIRDSEKHVELLEFLKENLTSA